MRYGFCFLPPVVYIESEVLKQTGAQENAADKPETVSNDSASRFRQSRPRQTPRHLPSSFEALRDDGNTRTHSI